MTEIFNMIDEIENEVISWRHYFHNNPELSYKEINTTKKLRNY